MLSNTTVTQAFAKRTFKVDSQILPLPLDMRPFYAGKPFMRYQKGLNVVFLGRLVERKGCLYLLRAIIELRRRQQWPAEARVIICGTGPLEQNLRQLCADQHIDDIVEFVGYISEADKPRYLAGADIAIYPSTGGESFGMVLLEGMAAARGAVLAANNPAYSVVMQPHPDSLFDPYNTSALADKLLQLLASPRQRHAFYTWQRQYVKQFDIDIIGRQTVDIYRQALHRRRG